MTWTGGLQYRTSRQQSFYLLALTDPETNYSYVMRGGQTFYLRYESDILGCAVGAGGFTWIKSHLKMPPAQNGVARAVERFAAEVDDNALVQMESHYTRVDLKQGLRFPLFTAKSMGGSQPAIPTVKALESTGSLLTLHLVSDGGKYQGTFSIDLNAGKLIRSSVDGAEVYRAR